MTTAPAVPIAIVRDGAPPRRGAPHRLVVYGLIMAASFVCYILSHMWTGAGGVASTVLQMSGLGACGWAWLFARALFDPAPHDAWWPRIVVGVVAVSGGLSVVEIAGGAGVARVIDNIYALSGSAALLLAFVEPFHRYRRDLPTSEKRFRFAFTAVYAALVAVSILGLGGSEATVEEARRIDLLRGGCALVSLVAGAAAIGFRLWRPLERTGGPQASRRAATADDRRLADRVLELVRREAIHTEPNLRVADVAARLGEPEYRVSQCITAALGFDNFNRMINHHRIEMAKRLLAGTDGRTSILEIAFDCGFGSVGPFNRAFKAETGVTPRAFRAAQREVRTEGAAGDEQRAA